MYRPQSSAALSMERLAFRAPLRLKKPMAQQTYHKPNDEAFDPQVLLGRVGTDRDRAAFVRLFNHYAPRLKSYLLKNGMDSAGAEEVVQNTFVTVWEKAASFNPARAAASTWIFTIARNKRIDALRRDRLIEINSDSPALANAVSVAQDTPYADDQAVGRLNAAIEDLPDEQARLLRMAFFEDKSHSVIAKETKIPLGTVKSRLRLGLDRLRQTLKGDDTP